MVIAVRSTADLVASVDCGPHSPVEAPVTGRWRLLLEQLSVEDVLELFAASQSCCPRGAVGFGDNCCVKLLTGRFFQRTRIS